MPAGESDIACRGKRYCAKRKAILYAGESDISIQGKAILHAGKSSIGSSSVSLASVSDNNKRDGDVRWGKRYCMQGKAILCQGESDIVCRGKRCM